MPEASFSVNAYLHGGRWQHHRLRDHFGAESDLYVTLNERIGPWEEGTPVHFVILDLLERMTALESSAHVLASFTCNSYILTPGIAVENPAGTWTTLMVLDAVVRRVPTGSFIGRAWIAGGGVFTANAVLRAQVTFTADAVLA